MTATIPVTDMAPPATAARSWKPETAMVLAAGLGERMRPLTLERPKPLIEVAGRTILDRALDALAAAGVPRAVVNLHYLGEMIDRHLASRTKPHVEFSREELRLETGGGIKQALPLLGADPFYVINADTVWLDGPTPTLTRLAARWDESEMDVLLLLHSVPKASGYHGRGDFLMDPLGRLKRRPPHQIAPYVYTGLHIASPRLFDGAPGGSYSLNRLWDRAEAAGRLYGLLHDGAWFHVGTPDALADVNRQLDERRARWFER